MKKLSVKPKRIGKRIGPTDDGLQYDAARRLRNALTALGELGPEWLRWAEGNLPQGLSIDEQAELAERGARCLVAKGYSFLGRGFKRQVIFSNYHFTDDGHLKGYL